MQNVHNITKQCTNSNNTMDLFDAINMGSSYHVKIDGLEITRNFQNTMQFFLRRGTICSGVGRLIRYLTFFFLLLIAFLLQLHVGFICNHIVQIQYNLRLT